MLQPTFSAAESFRAEPNNRRNQYLNNETEHRHNGRALKEVSYCPHSLSFADAFLLCVCVLLTGGLFEPFGWAPLSRRLGQLEVLPGSRDASCAALVFPNTGRVQSILRPSRFHSLALHSPRDHFLVFLAFVRIVENQVNRSSVSNRVEESK